ncbi:flotillin family protein [Candidatus Obscuribacterales bacterium]|nr:flotillin family protein [Candidatus Obscuribacterales bacterium]
MDPMIMVMGGIALIILFVQGILLAALYQKVGPNTALIVSGGAGKPKIVVGGGTIVLPIVNRMDTLSLEVMAIEMRCDATWTSDGIPLSVECVAQVKVRVDEQSIEKAAEHFLGKDIGQIKTLAQDVLMKQLRSSSSTMTAEKIIRDPNSLALRLEEGSNNELEKFGLTVVLCTIKEVRDSVGYHDALTKTAADEAKRIAVLGKVEDK